MGNKMSEVPRRGYPFILPKRTLGELFTGIESAEVSMLVSQIRGEEDVGMILPITELLVLAAICKYAQPRRIFEIGTYTGSSTFVMAMNTPCQTEVFTLDLDPSKSGMHEHGVEVGGLRAFTEGTSYQESPFAKKIHQLFGNSLTFDYSSFYGSIDLMFIDANHTYDFVKPDTENAFKLLRPGGIIMWDDYLWDEHHPECIGVARCLHELREIKRLFQLVGTRFAIYVDGA